MKNEKKIFDPREPVSQKEYSRLGQITYTEKKAADPELKQIQEQLQKIMDQSLDVICTINEQGEFVKLGAASLNTWGYLPSELTGRECISLVMEEDKEKTRLAFLSIRKGSETNHFENRCRHRSGQPVFITWSARWDKDDRLMYCVARDTSAIKKSEKKIREERMLLRSLIDILPINVYTKDLQSRKTLANRMDYEYAGCSSEAEVLGKTDLELYSEESAKNTLTQDELIMSSGEHIIGKEEQHIKKDGSKAWFLISKIPLRNEEKEITGLIGISFDITARKEAEEKIWIAKERYDMVVKATNEAIWDWDILSSRLYWGESYRVLFGYDPGMGQTLETWSNHVHPDDVERVVKSLIDAVRSTTTNKWEQEYRFMKANGTYAYVIDRGFVIHNDKGEPVRMTGALQDITNKLKTDEALRDSEEKRRLIMNSALDAIICMDEKGAITFWNPQAEEIFGWRSEEVLGSVLSDIIIQPAFRKLYTDSIEEYRRTGHNPHLNTLLEISAINRSNKKFPVELTILPITQGGEEFFCAFIRDITDRRKRENLLAKSEQGLKRSQEISHIGSWDADLINNITTWSEETYRVFGYEKGEIESSFSNYLSIIHPEDLQQVIQVTEAAKTDHKAFALTHRIIKKDGSVAIIYTEGRFIFNKAGAPVSIYGVHQDITPQKTAEAALQKRKMQLTVAADIARLGYWELNLDTSVFTFNDQFYALLKTTAEEMGGYEMSRERYGSLFVPETDRELIGREVQKAIESNDPGYSCHIEHRIKYATGETGYFAVSFFVVKDENGKPIKTVGANQDITDRKEAEEQLRLSNERYDLVTRATNDVIYEWDIINDTNYWGEGYETLFGHTRTGDKMPADTWTNNLHPDEQEELKASIREAFKNKKTSLSREMRFRCADGSYKPVFDNLIILYDKDQPVKVVGAMQDITQRKRNETSIIELNKKLNRRAEELVASNDELEQFAYVASHDLQEPLRMISSFLQLLQKKYQGELDDTAGQYIGQAVSGAERMKRLIMDLLEFSRVGTSRDQRTPTDMNQVMRQVLQIFSNKIKETNAIVTVSKMPVIEINKMQITQLFQNLVGNAFKYNTASIPAIEIGFEEKEDAWQFFVKDNGIGIDPKFFDKVFVIFQRLHTRNEFSGTGIGLAICKKIVERHGGTIWVESKVNAGSTFFFTIKKVNS